MFAVALTAMLILLAIWWRVLTWYENQLRAESRSSIYMALAPNSNALTSTIHRRIGVLKGLDAFVRAHPAIANPDTHLKEFISGLYAGTRGVRYLALAPGGVVRNIYPPEQQSRIYIGRDLINNPPPGTRSKIHEAIRTKRIFLNGPYETEKGRLALSAYAAIFNNGNFWGIAYVALDFYEILSTSGINKKFPGMRLALIDSRGKVIYSDGPVMDDDPVRLKIDLPGEHWALAAVPALDWEEVNEKEHRNFEISGFLIVGLLTVLIFLIMAQHERLQSTVTARTLDLKQELQERQLAEAALKESEEKYRRLFEGMRDSILVTNTDRIITDCNPTFTEMFGYTIEEIRRKSTRILCESDEQFLNFGKVIELYRDQPGFLHTIRFRKKGGAVFPAEINFFYIRNNVGKTVGYLGIIRDITEKAAAQAMAREREEQFRILAELAPAAIIIIGGKEANEYLYVNSAWERLSGYSKADAKTLHPIDLVHPDMRDAVIARRNARLRGEPVESRYEMHIITKDGRSKWIDFSAAVTTYAGEPVLIVIANDITDQKETKEALEKSEAMYRNLFENAPIGIFRSTSERFWNLNPEMSRILGCDTPEQAIGHFNNFREQLCISPMRYEDFIREVSEREFVEDFEFEAARFDGSRVWLSVNARLSERLPEKNFVMEGFALDITASRMAKDRIMHLNRILRSMQDINRLIARERDEESFLRQVCGLLVKNQGYIGAMIVLRDADGHFSRYFRAGMEEPFDHFKELFEKGTIPGCCREGTEDFRERGSICKDCPGRVSCLPEDILCIRLRHEDTSYGYFAVSAFHGQIEHEEEYSLFSQTSQDVAFALHNMEREKQARAAELARQHAEEQLFQAQKMDAIGRLAGGVAHDFNNMLNVILGYASIIRKRMDKNDPIYNYIMEIEQAAQRSAELTAHLLAFSRKQISEPRIIDMNEVIEEQLAILKRLIGEGIDIRFLPAFNLWNVRIDPMQIDQILTNLAVNSRDAIAGTGTITIRTENVTLGTRPATELSPGDYVLLTFSDTGIGMDEKTLEQIFEPFFTTKEVGKGTGLGLSTVYGIIKQNRGGIHVYSEPGMGTTFHIYFPRHRTESEIQEFRPESEALGGNETILIVEDEEQVLNLSEMILKEYGYNVQKARTPGEALKIAREHTIDLLLTDVIMPEMNGRQLSEEIRAVQPGIRTVFMSGYTDDVIASQGLLDSSAELIVKPFTVQSLTGKVRNALDRE